MDQVADPSDGRMQGFDVVVGVEGWDRAEVLVEDGVNLITDPGLHRPKD